MKEITNFKVGDLLLECANVAVSGGREEKYIYLIIKITDKGYPLKGKTIYESLQQGQISRCKPFVFYSELQKWQSDFYWIREKL